MTKYNIGDTVWLCEFGRHEVRVVCPDCLGSGKLTVTFGDGAQIGIDCDCCRYGFEHLGQVITYKWIVKTIQRHISGLEVNGNSIKYHFGTQCSYRSYEEKDVFATQEEAEVHGKILEAEHEIEEQKNFESKSQRHKPWKSNVAYYKHQAEYHKEQMEFAIKKMDMAIIKSNRYAPKEDPCPKTAKS